MKNKIFVFLTFLLVSSCAAVSDPDIQDAPVPPEEVAEKFLKESLSGDLDYALSMVDLEDQDTVQVIMDFKDFQKEVSAVGGLERIVVHKPHYQSQGMQATLPCSVFFKRRLYGSRQYDVPLYLMKNGSAWKVLFKKYSAVQPE